MKKLALFILGIAITAGTFAQSSHMDITSVKKITTDEVITALKVYDNVEVVLTDDSNMLIQIVGEKTCVESTVVKINNGELAISSHAAEFFKEKVVVYVPAANINKVYVHGSSLVSSIGTLSNEMMDVTINGEGRSAIKTTGYVNTNTIGNFPLDLNAR